MQGAPERVHSEGRQGPASSVSIDGPVTYVTTRVRFLGSEVWLTDVSKETSSTGRTSVCTTIHKEQGCVFSGVTF